HWVGKRLPRYFEIISARRHSEGSARRPPTVSIVLDPTAADRSDMLSLSGPLRRPLEPKESHAVCLVDATGRRREVRRIAHTAEAVETCLAWILECAEVPPTRIAVAIETPRGALIDACLVCGFRVFAVNPKQLDRFRDRHTVAGAKDDRRDAWVLADSLRTDAAAFQPVHQEDPIVVQLRELSRAEDDLDGEFRRLANQLRSQLHRLVPEILALCPGADEPWLWALLAVAPSPMEQRRLTRARVDHLLRAHRIRRWRADDVLARLQAPHFPHAPGVAEAVEAQIR